MSAHKSSDDAPTLISVAFERNRANASPISPPLESEPNRPKAVHNIFWLIAERGVKAVGSVVMGVLIARHLGPTHYGSYGAAMGLATLAKDAVILGFDRMIRRDLAARPADSGKIIGTSIGWALMFAFVTALGLSALAGKFVDDNETLELALIVVWMAIPQAFFSCEVWFESSGQARPLVRTRNVVWTISLICRLGLILSGARVFSFAVLALVEWTVTYAAVCGLLRKVHGNTLRFSYSSGQLKAWFREGWPMVAMVVVGSTADRIMVLLVHNLAVSDVEAGYLNAALRITEIWWSMSTIIAAVLLPRIVAMQNSDSARCANTMQVYANASLVVSVIAAITVTVSAPFLIPWLFGSAYGPSARVIVILFWSGPAVFPAVARAQIWVTRGKLIFDLPSVSLITLLQLSFTALLVPRYGAVGAAIAMTSAQWLGFYGLILTVPVMRRASQAQLQAFRALYSPLATIRSLRAFVGNLARK